MTTSVIVANCMIEELSKINPQSYVQTDRRTIWMYVEGLAAINPFS